jgi:phage-related protein (TIGR01555 family)
MQKKPRKSVTTRTVVNASDAFARDIKINNGLGEALFGGFNPGSTGTPLNQVDTLFKNNRNYLVSNMRQLLSQSYVEHGLIQTVVDVPVDDGMRGGVELKTKQLDPDQIQDLHNTMEREDILNSSIGQALKWNRLFGGAGCMIITDQDCEKPFDISAIREDSPLEFRAVDMWELFYDKQSVEGYNPDTQDHTSDHYDYYAKRVHKSRVMKMKGLTAPSFVRPRLRGWGFSVVEALVNSINQYLKANNLTFEVLDEFKVDYYKIDDLARTLMLPGGTEKIQKRVQIMNQQKSFQKAVTMDAKDDWIQKQLMFSGISETMTGIRMQVASDLRMPLTKIFGISASGFSSGQDDIENYNAMVESQVRAKSKYDILKIIEILCQKKYQFVPDDLSITFKPLRMLSAEQEENVKTQKHARLLSTRQAGEITSLEFRDGCNKGNLLEIQLDTDDQSMEEVKDDKQSKDDAANRSDSRNPTASAGAGAKSTKVAKEPVEAEA